MRYSVVPSTMKETPSLQVGRYVGCGNMECYIVTVFHTPEPLTVIFHSVISSYIINIKGCKCQLPNLQTEITAYSLRPTILNVTASCHSSTGHPGVHHGVPGCLECGTGPDWGRAVC